MPTRPQFLYFLSRPQIPVSKDRSIWQQPLPMTREQFCNPSRQNGAILITYGEYFLAVRSFLEKNGCKILIEAVRQHLQQDIKTEDIEQIRTFLEKHGEFYHPCRIEMKVHGQQIYFVLNVAVSKIGKKYITDEYGTLKKLNQKYSLTYLPQVYGKGEVQINGNLSVAMFMGEWFNTYYEFHISRDRSDNKNKIVVWDPERGHYFLSADQSLDLYTRAAEILTSYYNLESFEQICSWHHAAGDFVINLENEKIDLKLITVRQYASRFNNLDDRNNTGNHAEFILQALLVFFLSLSLKMRLDRRDGVGDIVWADEAAVQGTLIGFLNALALKPQVPSLPDSPLRCFFYYLSMCSKSDLFELSETILATFNSNLPEGDAIKQHLSNHIDTLYRCIHQL